MRSYLFVHPLVIVVKPLHFLWRQQGGDDGGLVDRAEGQCLELQEASKGCFLVRLYEQGVLNAYAKLSLLIDAGLVCHRHAGMQWGRLVLHANLMRSLVNVQVGTHAVSCAVQEVQPLMPQVLAGYGIELGATGSVGELE